MSVMVVGVRAGRLVSAGRHKHTLSTEQPQPQQQKQPQQKQLHQAVSGVTHFQPSYIPLPANVEELKASEKARFSPRRNRDISSKLNQVGNVFSSGFMGNQGLQSVYNSGTLPVDSHVDVYDARITVSLSSVMQTNVPKPYGISGKAPVHLNMPGGQWAQDDKYVSGDLHDHHHSTITSKKNPGTALLTFGSLGHGSLLKSVALSKLSGLYYRGLMTMRGNSRIDYLNSRQFSTCVNSVCLISNKSAACVTLVCGRGSMGHARCFHKCAVYSKQDSQFSELKTKDDPKVQLTSKQKLQRAVKEYGATVIVFHVAISLASLGICYLLVSSGVDMTGVFKSLGINIGRVTEGAAAFGSETSTSLESVPEEVHGEAVATESLQCSNMAEGVAAEVAGNVDSLEVSAVDLNTLRAAGAATFVVAYAVHKVFAPARIAITLTATPFIVRHLRKIGFLKQPKAS